MKRGNKDYYNGQFFNYDGSDVNELIDHQKDFAVIEDDKVSDKTTYSSTKIEELIGSSSNGTPLIDKTSDASSTFDIEPNKMYMFGERTTLTINLAPGKSDIVNEYMFQFTSGNVATTLNVPLTVTWLEDPDIQTSSIYQVSIENNLGVIGKWNNE